MTIVTLNTKKKIQREESFLGEGFRIFFLGAAAFSATSMTLWALIYSFSLPVFLPHNIPIFIWHAHQMIFGFTLAVIAGFLLTAVTNWTGRETLNGLSLLVCFMFWLLARICFIVGGPLGLKLAFLFDIVFGLILIYAVVKPIYLAKNWGQAGVISKLILLVTTNLLFYLEVFGATSWSYKFSIYGSLFIIVSLILTVGGSMMPAFLQNTLNLPDAPTPPKWLMLSSLFLILIFFALYIFSPFQTIAGYLSFAIAVVNSIRLYYWYNHRMWKAPLLWGLYLALFFIDLGFYLYALHLVLGLSKYQAIHSFAAGGIGLACLSMMCRATLGHSGLDVMRPPRLVFVSILLLTVSVVLRVILPYFLESYLVIMWSQFFWISAFLLFILIFFKPLTRYS